MSPCPQLAWLGLLWEGLGVGAGSDTLVMLSCSLDNKVCSLSASCFWYLSVMSLWGFLKRLKYIIFYRFVTSLWRHDKEADAGRVELLSLHLGRASRGGRRCFHPLLFCEVQKETLSPHRFQKNIIVLLSLAASLDITNFNLIEEAEDIKLGLFQIRLFFLLFYSS